MTVPADRCSAAERANIDTRILLACTFFIIGSIHGGFFGFSNAGSGFTFICDRH
jgi:hypothetical protein